MSVAPGLSSGRQQRSSRSARSSLRTDIRHCRVWSLGYESVALGHLTGALQAAMLEYLAPASLNTGNPGRSSADGDMRLDRNTMLDAINHRSDSIGGGQFEVQPHGGMPNHVITSVPEAAETRATMGRW